MNSNYDVVVIGGGHNGLVNAAYLARAGKKVLVLERRHVLGGAAVTEEIFPGFKFSVASYVVSLLRPEIIRELDLPRHGMEVLPLDGTFTPMPDGDYLWRVNDHAKTRREIARHSRLDAEAYDEYGKAMVEMGRFVKPILGMTAPDPASLTLRGLSDMLSLARRFKRLPSNDKYNQVQLMTMSAADSARGVSFAVEPAPSPTPLPKPRGKPARRFARKLQPQGSPLRTGRRRESFWRMATKSQPTWFLQASIPV
jgi:phytoene dehydrogenase-like protein